ncbi:MAG: DUF1071 domain-containing protein [Candidatus Thioglobus sp.]|jgi:hypothetical protein|nr:DUF1071 domain-containing protein [Candidatus Thioglobus sp.]
MSVFETLNKIDVNEHTEHKGNLTYLSWAWAWQVTKQHYPKATYTVYENGDGWNYHHDLKTAWVKTGVTIDDIEHIEYLPVLDFKNKSIALDKLTSFNVNTAIQRSLTKAIARHGLGLYIYAGEDLPSTPIWLDKSMKDNYIKQMLSSIVESDEVGIVELWRDLNKAQQGDTWKEFNDTQHVFIKEALSNTQV